MKHVEIIAIGNEILAGDTLDTNTNWICKRLTMIGARIERTVSVRDDIQSIAREIRDSQTRRPALLITLGGMGPTPDDMTVQAVGNAVGRDVTLNEIALTMVSARYAELVNEGSVENAEMTPPRKKMACLPLGAVPLENKVGTAPAVYLELDETVMICLPGVPAEMKGIFDDALQEPLRRIFGNASAAERHFLVTCSDESILAPLIAELSARHSDTTFKSRPKVYGDGVRLRVRLFSVGDTKSETTEKLNRAVADFLQTVAEAKLDAHEQPEG